MSGDGEAARVLEALTDEEIARRKAHLRRILASSVASEAGGAILVGSGGGSAAEPDTSRENMPKRRSKKPSRGGAHDAVRGEDGAGAAPTGGGVTKKAYPKPRIVAEDGGGMGSGRGVKDDAADDTAGASATSPEAPPAKRPIAIKSFEDVMAEKRAKREAEAAAAATGAGPSDAALAKDATPRGRPASTAEQVRARLELRRAKQLARAASAREEVARGVRHAAACAREGD